MAIYNIKFENRAKKEFIALPKPIQILMSELLENLSENPRPPGAKKLVGQNGFRMRKGDYRLLYTIDETSHELIVYRIGHRREVYR